MSILNHRHSQHWSLSLQNMLDHQEEKEVRYFLAVLEPTVGRGPGPSSVLMITSFRSHSPGSNN